MSQTTSRVSQSVVLGDKKNDKTSVFYGFKNKYALSKTLRFELVPIGNTQQMLEDEQVFEKDEIIEKKYKNTKPYFDRLHREFVQESLQDKKIEGLDDYFDILKKLQKNKKDTDVQKQFKEISQQLRTNLNSYFDTKDLFGERVFFLLKEKYGEEEKSFIFNEETGEFILDEKGDKISIFDSWKGFTGYFTKFQETRKNFYKDDGTATAIATRIVDQNLKRFCENIQLFESLEGKIDFSEVEELFNIKLSDFFILDFYNSCLLQGGIDTYNEILGGKVLENSEKIKGLNEVINKYRQDNKEDKVGFFKMLDKQILSEKTDFIENIKDDNELLQKLKEFYASSEEKTNLLKTIFNKFVSENDTYNLSQIYISKEGLNTILQKWMTQEGKNEFERITFEKNKKEKVIDFDKDNNSYKFISDFVAFEYIKNSLLGGDFVDNTIWKTKYYVDEENSSGFLKKDTDLWTQFLEILLNEFKSLFSGNDNNGGYDFYKTQFEELVSNQVNKFEVFPESKLVIKNFVDSTLWIYQMGKYFAIEKKRKWLDSEYEVDSNFYEHSEYGYRSRFYVDAYDKIVKARMLLQSYLTKKPFNTDKWKLNFENPTLADGFDRNKESANSAVILRKDGYYFLAIMKKGHSKIFDDNNIEKIDSNSYEKMVYKSISDPVKDIPNLMVINGKTVRKTGRKDKKTGVNHILEELKNQYLPEKINRIRKLGSYLKTSDNFNTKESQEYLAYYMHRLIEYKKDEFDFKFKGPEEYSCYAEFLDDVGRQGYKVFFDDISDRYVMKKNSDGDLFLFKIHNKDWNLKDDKNKTGKNNIHTMYFESLFSHENIESNFLFKLNGEAELFYRPKTDINKLGYKIKDEKNGKWKKVARKESEGIPEGVVVDHRRYSQNKVFFHVPITLNRTVGDIYNFNKQVNEFLVDNQDINIIGLDRGEKHLIYYAGIDQKGNILKDKNGKEVLGSLNEVNGVNYYTLLEERAKGRERARQDWQEIENIKDLKKGYISVVVRKLADLIIEHNAILVFEDLNMRFKQIRGGIEKSVYQQLEKALIDKLNFLVNKGEKDPEQAGHLLRAYQLTAPFTTFKDMGKQTGIIFYTQASYTSKTCPSCGFRPNIRWDAKDLIEKIRNTKIDIEFENDHFNIKYSLSDFIKTQNPSKRGNILYREKNKKDGFHLSTKDAIRYKWFKRDLKDIELHLGEQKMKLQTETGVTIEYNLTDCLKGLFEKNNIDYTGDIISQLQKKESELLKKFYDKLSFYLYILTNTRSSVSGTEIDYINCPSCEFHSSNGFKGLKFNGDANGAYNIARKGIMILEKLKKYKDDNSNLDKLGWGELFIDIEEWDKFTQK